MNSEMIVTGPFGAARPNIRLAEDRIPSATNAWDVRHILFSSGDGSVRFPISRLVDEVTALTLMGIGDWGAIRAGHQWALSVSSNHPFSEGQIPGNI